MGSTSIIGNPPYSAGQDSANDNNQNVTYPHLDSRIRDTYAARSTATNKNALYDSYIRSIRWASDRVGDSGVIGFVTNAGFVEANTADGMRQCLAEEFSSIYVFHLRGNQRTSGELSRKEGGKIFGSGSRAPIAISLLVKNPAAKRHGQIHFHDIGDYLSQSEKLEVVERFQSIEGVSEASGWQAITPDTHGDWVKQRDNSFGEFIVLGDKKGNESTKLFANYSRGLETGRDAWCFNASKTDIGENMSRMIDFYSREVARFNTAHIGLDKRARKEKVDNFIDTDPAKISWTSSLKRELAESRSFVFDGSRLAASLYRPFTKQWVYYDATFNHRVGQMPKIFPDAKAMNRVICTSGVGDKVAFSALIADAIPSLHMVDIDGSQCFPRYVYGEAGNVGETKPQGGLFEGKTPQNVRQDALTDEGLEYFRIAYLGEAITKEDVFYYVYGLLHSPDYRKRYADNLSKELPRIPRVKNADPARRYGTGRALAQEW